MQNAMYPRDEAGRLRVSRKGGRRGLASIENSVYESIQLIEDYLKNAKDDWLQWPETIQTTQASTVEK